MSIPLSRLLNGLGMVYTGFRDVQIEAVTCDSRDVVPGALFVAIPGNKKDGTEYIDEAIRRGAVAIVATKVVYPVPKIPLAVVPDVRLAYSEIAARFHGYPSARLNVIGITGTNGKTTTTFLLKAMLDAARDKSGLLGTVYNILGDKPVASHMTTPDAETIHSCMAEMVKRGCRSCVMEVSSHSLMQERVRSVNFAAAILSNVTRDHMDYHKTFEEYRAAKARLFEQLPPHGIACLNADDPSCDWFAERSTGRVVTYGLEKGDIRATIHENSINGLRFTVHFSPGVDLEIHSPLIGKHNVYNMLSAAATLYAMGYDLEPMRAGLDGMRSVPGRLEEISLCQDFKVFVDYAHTPDALERVITALKPLTPGKVWVVFGCGGDRDRGKRPLMGKVVEELSDQFVITSDNPRSEDPLAIVSEICAGLAQKSKHQIILDRRDAIRAAIMQARTGDTVLVAGKGHEDYQIVQDTVHPFDDRVVAYEALKERIVQLT
jgi:UDP-N-acetylmuramoyl-L-alanyl-D-glutamate--2,6-diaminopimelate ligase